MTASKHSNIRTTSTTPATKRSSTKAAKPSKATSASKASKPPKTPATVTNIGEVRRARIDDELEQLDDELALRVPATCREALLHDLAASGNAWRRAAEAFTSSGNLYVAVNRYSAAAGSYEDAAECAASADGMSDEERQLFIAEALDAAAWMRDAVAQIMRREEIESGARDEAA